MEINTNLKIGDEVQWRRGSFDAIFDGYYIIEFKESAASLSFLCVDRCHSKCIYANKWIIVGKDPISADGYSVLPCNLRKVKHD